MKPEVIYAVRVASFQDSNGDGIGDLEGIRQRLGHVASLGVTVLWLLPFQPSPRKDDGYDVSNYKDVDPRYGTLEDFRRLVAETHAHGLKILVDLVLNHTSNEHPWFQRARRAPAGSEERNYYVWSDSPDRYRGVRIIFAEDEPANWTWDEAAGAWYWHRFYREQPDLNWEHPPVRAAMREVMDFWLDEGVDGFRLDAVPYLHEEEGTTCEGLPMTHGRLKELREHVEAKAPGTMLLAEANAPLPHLKEYFGTGDECTHVLHFPRMTASFLAAAREDPAPMVQVLRAERDLPPGCTWATFLRNHDELSTEQLTESERLELLERFAPRIGQRRFGGIRRRLATLLGDARLWRLMHGLWLLGPGTPVLWYGEELAMREVQGMPDRMGLRTPMLWDDSPSAGFSTAVPGTLEGPISRARGGPVSQQEKSLRSPLGFVRQLLAMRRNRPEVTAPLLHVGTRDAALVMCAGIEHPTTLVIGWLDRKGGLVDVELPSGVDHKALVLEERLFGGGRLSIREGRVRGQLGPWGFAVLAVR